MGHQQIDVDAHSPAEPERVWTLLADATTWPSWSSFATAEMERPGTEHPDGVGAIRRMRRGRTQGRELVVAFEPPRHFAYELLSGLPVRDYRGDVTLTATETGTAIHWQARYRDRIPLTGAATRRRLRSFLQETADALARAAAGTG